MIAHIINTDVGKRGVLPLYLEYRRKNFNFLKESAKLLLDNCERVLIITGFTVPPHFIPETDGPPGALAIYQAVETLGGRAEILTYPEVEEAMEPFHVRFIRRPEVEDYSLVVAVETPGRAGDGKYYSMSGLEVRREGLDDVVIAARNEGIPTIGIGDGGNEAGMGNIRGLVGRYIPHGKRIASTVKVDWLVLSAVSNWGAYGLVVEASLEAGKNLLEEWNEGAVVKLLAERGLIDGVTKRREPSVDGIDLRVHEAIVGLLKAILDENLGD